MFFPNETSVWETPVKNQKGKVATGGKQRSWAKIQLQIWCARTLFFSARCVDFGLQRATALITREMAYFSLCAFCAAPGADFR